MSGRGDSPVCAGDNLIGEIDQSTPGWLWQRDQLIGRDLTWRRPRDAFVARLALLDREFRATRLHSSGSFLKQSNATIIVGAEDDQVEPILEIVRATCTPRTQIVNPMPPIMEPGEFFMPYPLEVEVGGATVFVLPVERFERL